MLYTYTLVYVWMQFSCVYVYMCAFKVRMGMWNIKYQLQSCSSSWVKAEGLGQKLEGEGSGGW